MIVIPGYGDLPIISTFLDHPAKKAGLKLFTII